MAQRSRELATLPVDQSSDPSTHTGRLANAWTSSSKESDALSGLQGRLYTHVHTHADTHTHNKTITKIYPCRLSPKPAFEF